MRDILYPAHVPAEPDPVKRAQAAMARHPLPSRFYTSVSVAEEGGFFALKLDGRGAKTPARKALALPSLAAARLLAAEWEAQKDIINPDTMPVTRIVNSALDGVSERMEEVAEEIAGYAASDLVCYRTDDPPGLAVEQVRHWDRVITWADAALGAHFVLASGIIHAAQPPAALRVVSNAICAIRDPVALAALHVMTTLSGSCLIALMASRGAATLAEAWEASVVDETWSISLWGQDDEASARLARRRADFDAAYALFQAVS
jgi:chaperone required for assembly of F1-ATPase